MKISQHYARNVKGFTVQRVFLNWMTSSYNIYYSPLRIRPIAKLDYLYSYFVTLHWTRSLVFGCATWRTVHRHLSSHFISGCIPATAILCPQVTLYSKNKYRTFYRHKGFACCLDVEMKTKHLRSVHVVLRFMLDTVSECSWLDDFILSHSDVRHHLYFAV
jgi:hypothetical protein